MYSEMVQNYHNSSGHSITGITGMIMGLVHKVVQLVYMVYMYINFLYKYTKSYIVQIMCQIIL